MADWIPGISQLKSGFQLICGDVQGAKNTQKNFVRQCPVVSQATSLVQLAVGDVDGAAETQKECGRTMGRVVDGIPVVGHAKGVIHYACGDTEGGNRAMRSSTRTTAVLGAGAGGFLVGGPVGAVAAGIGTGATMDTVYTVATDTPQGYYAAIDNVIKNPSADKFFTPLLFSFCSSFLRGFFDAALMPVGDGMTGMAGGTVVRSIQSSIQLRQAGDLYSRADAALQAAEANAGKVPDAVSIQQYNTAADLFNKAQALEAKATGTPVAASGVPGKEGQAAAATSSSARGGSSVTVPASNVASEGYDGNGDDDPEKRLARIKSQCEGNLTYRRRRTGRRPGIPDALDIEGQTMQEANERIVTQMVEYAENVDFLPDGARTIIVDQLQAFRALNEFHHFCARDRAVEVTLEFSGTRGNGEIWEITFQINIDNVQTERQGPHLGYEIHTQNLGKKRIDKQVGHVYLPRVPIGRPRLGQDYLLDQYRTDKKTYTLNYGPNAGLKVFFQCVITFFRG